MLDLASILYVYIYIPLLCHTIVMYWCSIWVLSL